MSLNRAWLELLNQQRARQQWRDVAVLLLHVFLLSSCLTKKQNKTQLSRCQSSLVNSKKIETLLGNHQVLIDPPPERDVHKNDKQV